MGRFGGEFRRAFSPHFFRVFDPTVTMLQYGSHIALGDSIYGVSVKCARRYRGVDVNTRK